MPEVSKARTMRPYNFIRRQRIVSRSVTTLTDGRVSQDFCRALVGHPLAGTNICGLSSSWLAAEALRAEAVPSKRG
jgi:hypothetical protein